LATRLAQQTGDRPQPARPLPLPQDGDRAAGSSNRDCSAIPSLAGRLAGTNTIAAADVLSFHHFEKWLWVFVTSS